MNNAENARQIAVEMFMELGGDSQQTVSQSWLVRNGYIVGRRFVCGSLSAVWFSEENEVKVYDLAGKVLKAVAVLEAERKAA